MSDTVLVTRHGAITLITLDRPEVRNAVDAATAQALHRAFLEFDADPAARVAVFHGAHGHFCAGWDLQAAARMQADEGSVLYSHGVALDNLNEGIGLKGVDTRDALMGMIAREEFDRDAVLAHQRSYKGFSAGLGELIGRMKVLQDDERGLKQQKVRGLTNEERQALQAGIQSARHLQSNAGPWQRNHFQLAFQYLPCFSRCQKTRFFDIFWPLCKPQDR